MPSFALVHCVLCMALFELTSTLDTPDMQEVPALTGVGLP